VDRLSHVSALRVLGDWGTTRLRLLLVDDQDVVDQRDGPGIGALDRTPADTLTGLIGDWSDRGSLQIVLAGMAGSRNGLIETPYASTPADRSAWSRAARSVVLNNFRITVAAGLRHDRGNIADVMRGEDNQIYGALEVNPALREGSHVVILPGTHSKWVEIEDGSIVRFHTALTGELFALLRDHSILLRTGAASEHIQAEADAGFSTGVTRAFESGIGLVNHAFEARSAQLLHGQSRSWASGFLSGLVIAEEIAGLGRRYPVAQGVTLVGDPRLTTLYMSAFAQHGLRADHLDGATCALRGLRLLDNFTAGHTS
jgi:2-dehydro-3-deoxygalactonokinase